MSLVEKLPAKEVLERFPHVPPKALYSARYNGVISATERDDLPRNAKYVYHIDRDFKLWQARYLDTDPAPEPGEASSKSIHRAALPVPIVELAARFQAVREAHRAVIDAAYDGGAEGKRERMRREVMRARRALTEVDRLLDTVARLAGIEPADIMALPEVSGDGADANETPEAHA